MTSIARMRIYLDTNVFVVAVEHSGKVSELVWDLLNEGARRRSLLVTSELTLAEVLVKPLQLRGEGIAPQREVSSGNPFVLTPGTAAAVYADLIEQRPALDVMHVDRNILVLAAFHRAADRSIKLPDAIHLATAEQSSCTHVVTADRKLKSSAQYRFRRVDLEIAALNGLLAEVA